MNMETRKTSFEEKLKENLGAEYKATFPQRMEKQDEEFLRLESKNPVNQLEFGYT
ncbi:hypothetical protein [Enterocloster sp.]|uniref:hypothetical protein n=1 Tax=Enterocloster sp. TaxID=2719315 RepID=UPI0039A0869A